MCHSMMQVFHLNVVNLQKTMSLLLGGQDKSEVLSIVLFILKQ